MSWSCVKLHVIILFCREDVLDTLAQKYADSEHNRFAEGVSMQNGKRSEKRFKSTQETLNYVSVCARLRLLRLSTCVYD